MAQVVGAGQIRLNNGQVINPQTGGWYDAQQYWDGTLSNPGQINAKSNQQGAGQNVSQAVIAQTNPANVAYVNQQRASQSLPPSPTSAAPVSGPVAAPSSASTSSGPTMAPPTPFDLVGATNAAYNTPEITTANQAITDLNSKITTRQQALADAQAGINDNPFYSEATRVGKSQKLTEQANNDITVLQNQHNDAVAQVASLKADAAIKVNAAQGQYNINRAAYQDSLTQFNTILAAGGLTHATAQDLANYSASTGISYSVLQSMQEQEQQKNTKTQIIPSTDANGNVTITAVDSQTGQILNQVSAGDISQGKGKTDKSPSTKAPDTNKYLNQATKYLASADIAVTGAGTADKKLSKDEAGQAYQQVLALVGGNQDMADAVFNQAMNAGGYQKYGNW